MGASMHGRPKALFFVPRDELVRRDRSGPGADSQAVADGSRSRGGHMRNRSIGLTLFSGLAILVAACSTGGGASPSAASAAPPASAPAGSAASTEPSAA